MLKNSTWWERGIALAAIVALAGCIISAHVSCGRPDLVFSGQFPSQTPVETETPTPTPIQ